MKKILFIIILLMYLAALKAQVKSSHDGFYSTDSVFYQLSGSEKFKYCVNCYSADSLHSYTGGVWLYSREHAPNAWENMQFSNDKLSGDTIHIRENVVKGNTVWVRIYNDTGYTDQHHFVFLGHWRPKTAEVVSLFVDSSDFLGPHGFYGPGMGMVENSKYRWNYMLKIEKPCSYQFYGGNDWKLEAAQTSGILIGANFSAIHPDKGMELNANLSPGNKKFLQTGKSLTDSLDNNIKVLRFRVGGGNHQNNILANEIGNAIIRPDIGGTPSTTICVFVNGSFWTYAFAEENLNANRISKALNVERKQLVTVKVPIVAPMAELRKRKVALTMLNNSVCSVCGFKKNVCQLFYIYNDTIQFEIDTADVGYNAAAIESLCAAVKQGNDSLLASVIDRESFYRYAFSIWFFQNPEGWATRVMLAKNASLPWRIFSEHYDFIPHSAMANDWDEYFARFYVPGHSPAKRSLPWQATKRMFAFDRDYFCLVIEDELNTTYKPERTTAIAQQKIAALRPCIGECSRAWWPNGWLDSLSWETSVSTIVPFLAKRPTGIETALPKIFMTGSDTLLTPQNMHEVKVIFDSIQGKDVVVKLNSLELKSNFSGKYYPHPDLRVGLIYNHAQYQFVRWQEYPKEPESFLLSAGQNITLTPVLRLRKG